MSKKKARFGEKKYFLSGEQAVEFPHKPRKLGVFYYKRTRLYANVTPRRQKKKAHSVLPGFRSLNSN